MMALGLTIWVRNRRPSTTAIVAGVKCSPVIFSIEYPPAFFRLKPIPAGVHGGVIWVIESGGGMSSG